MRVDGQFDLTETVVNGRITLVNAYVSGELIINGTKIINPGSWTLFAGGLAVEGTLFARYGGLFIGRLRIPENANIVGVSGMKIGSLPERIELPTQS